MVKFTGRGQASKRAPTEMEDSRFEDKRHQVEANDKAKPTTHLQELNPNTLEEREPSLYGSMYEDPDRFETPQGKKKPIGRGSYGQVKAVEDPNQGQIAIKIIHNINEDSIEGLTEHEVSTEGRALLRLQGINHIPKLYGAKFKNKTYRIMMEMARGKSLEEPPDDLSTKSKRAIARQLLTTINECHQRGVAHLDIKPGNLIFHRDSRELTIVDFGSARFFTPGKPVTDALGDIPRGTEAFRNLEITNAGNLVEIDKYSIAVSLASIFAGFSHIEPEKFLNANWAKAGEKDFIRACLKPGSLSDLLQHPWLSE